MGKCSKFSNTLPSGPASIINLSNFLLSQKYINILTKGLKYIPKPDKIRKNDINQTFSNYSRRIKLQAYFYSKTKSSKQPNFKIPSNWLPHDEDIDDNIKEILNKLRKKLLKCKLNNNKNSNSHKEIKALRNLRNNHAIVIKPADKGNSIIIQNKTDYLTEAKRQLFNPQHYQKLEKPISVEDHDKINELLTKLKQKKYISKKELEFFQPDPDGRSRLIYFTPKIHKDPVTWPNKNIPSARPIVSDVGSDLYNISKLIDFYLTPFSNKHPSYIKDTPDFINKLSQVKIPENAYLITLDVESLYTNINTEQGIEAIKLMTQTYPNQERPDKEMLELINICLNNNDFIFNKEWFLQIYGTAMGKNFSPRYADIFMAIFEKQALTKCNKKPLVYFRFLDDIFLVWIHTLQEFRDMLEVFNNHNKTIKFKANIDIFSITFLDVTIYKGKRFQQHKILDTKVHFKPTDTHELLHKKSYHPQHTFKGILKGQIIRFVRICNNNKDMRNAINTVFPILHKRGYKPQFTLDIYRKTMEDIYIAQNPSLTIKKCQVAQCKLHKYLKPLKKLEYNNTSMDITDHMDCSSRNIIYSIKCSLCHLIYIGQTSQTLRQRFQGHKSNILLDKNKLLAKHINRCMKIFKHSDWHNLPLTITPIVKVKTEEDKITNMLNLINKETEIITKFKTITPFGINGPNDSQGSIPIILKYSDNTRTIATLFRDHHEQLRREFPKIFRRDLLVAHMRNKNITDYLVRAELTTSSADNSNSRQSNQ